MIVLASDEAVRTDNAIPDGRFAFATARQTAIGTMTKSIEAIENVGEGFGGVFGGS